MTRNIFQILKLRQSLRNKCRILLLSLSFCFTESIEESKYVLYRILFFIAYMICTLSF